MKLVQTVSLGILIFQVGIAQAVVGPADDFATDVRKEETAGSSLGPAEPEVETSSLPSSMKEFDEAGGEDIVDGSSIDGDDKPEIDPNDAKRKELEDKINKFCDAKIKSSKLFHSKEDCVNDTVYAARVCQRFGDGKVNLSTDDPYLQGSTVYEQCMSCMVFSEDYNHERYESKAEARVEKFSKGAASCQDTVMAYSYFEDKEKLGELTASEQKEYRRIQRALSISGCSKVVVRAGMPMLQEEESKPQFKCVNTEFTFDRRSNNNYLQCGRKMRNGLAAVLNYDIDYGALGVSKKTVGLTTINAGQLQGDGFATLKPATERAKLGNLIDHVQVDSKGFFGTRFYRVYVDQKPKVATWRKARSLQVIMQKNRGRDHGASCFVPAGKKKALFDFIDRTVSNGNPGMSTDGNVQAGSNGVSASANGNVPLPGNNGTAPSGAEQSQNVPLPGNVASSANPNDSHIVIEGGTTGEVAQAGAQERSPAVRPQGQPGTIADGEIFGSANRIPLIVGPLSDAIDHLTSPKNSQSSKAVEEDDVEILSDEEQDDSELTKLESLYVKAVNFNNEAVTENAKVDYSSDDKTDPVQIQKVIEALEKGIVAATEAQQFYEISENHTEEMNQTKSEIDAMKERMVVALELSKKNLENLSAVNNRNTSKKKSRGKKRKNSHSAKGSAAK